MQIQIDHEFKTLLAPLSAEEFAGLEEDILRDGCRVPLDVWRGILIDGHNRHEICTKHGLSFDVAEREFDDREDVKTWIIRNQLNRRNQTPEQTSYYRGKLYEQMKKAPHRPEKGGQNVHLNGPEKTAAVVAEQYGVDEKTVRRDAAYAAAVDTLADVAGEEVKQQILAGSLPITKKDVVALAAQPVEKQKAVIEKVATGEARSVRDAERIERQSERRELAVKAPTGKFAVIYADPPWQYDNSGFNESAESQYPTMPLEDICEMREQIDEWATDETVLFMWATNPLLPEALKVMNAWGFTYKTNIAWVKDKGRGKGWFLLSKHELLLIGVRRNTPQPVARPESAIEAPRPNKHSKKPEVFYDVIESMYGGAKIEMFCRSQREGWEAHGNQL